MKLSFSRINVADNWQPVLLGVVGLAVCLFLYTFNIGSLVSGFSQEEIRSISMADSGKDIIKDPSFMPHKIMQYSLIKAGFSSARALRSVNIIFALTSIVLFYYIMLRWHSHRIAILSSIIFASSSWMLHMGRIASPYILYTFAPLLVIACGVYLRKSRRKMMSTLLCASVAAFSLYVPYIVYFLLPILLWRSYAILKSKHRPQWWQVLMGATLFLLFMCPYIYAVISNTDILRQLVGYPSFNDIIQVGLYSFEYAKSMFIGLRIILPSYWLIGQPVLDIASSILLLLGVITYMKYIKLQRSKMTLLAILAGSVIIVLNRDIYAISLVIPFIYMVIGGGLTHLLAEWFKVFPRNPIARNFGACMISILVAMIVFYNLNSYFIAWPLTPDTKRAFTTVKVL